MKLNKKGITIVEIIVSIALISIILIMVFRLLAEVQHEDSLTKDRAANLINQSLMIKTIQDDLTQKRLTSLKKCGTGCYDFVYTSFTKRLTITAKDIKYGDETRSLTGNASYDLSNIKIETDGLSTYDHYFRMTIPASDKLNNNYDVEVFYVYDNSTAVSIT